MSFKRKDEYSECSGTWNWKQSFIAVQEELKIPWIIDDSFTKNSHCQVSDNTGFDFLENINI